ncbi:50S ribosomal subunit protein L2 [Candidatus Xenohaliotis californiensis]|uniref:50S ribosomal protein L2 n=1 Tax=Candidatus Xenohaliotis californiensis TaxID=84677 RepID=A0ABP0EWV6_9RICK|nr:50S ribosomal subunit protein L2 [Candidatus Xenohaliotis californiensis]
MPIKTYNPITPGTRHLALVDKSSLYSGSPCKSLTTGFAKKGGRNNRGVITVRSIGGGSKRKYRKINFKLSRYTGNAEVLRIEYDPNRSAFIALVKLDTGELNYILASSKMKSGDIISIGKDAEAKNGNTMQLKDIPLGFSIFAIEIKPKAGAQLVRAAGGYATLVAKDAGKALVRLHSGVSMYLNASCFATIGTVSNSDKYNISLGKAGRSRIMGKRPKVRGVAMNPVDHPHGGGEGKTGTGGPPVTPWGKLTKGAKTVIKKKKKKG